MSRIAIICPTKNALPTFLLDAVALASKNNGWHCTLYTNDNKINKWNFQQRKLPFLLSIFLIHSLFYRKLLSIFFARLDGHYDQFILSSRYQFKNISSLALFYYHVKKNRDIDYIINQLEKLNKSVHFRYITNIALPTISKKKHIQLVEPYCDDLPIDVQNNRDYSLASYQLQPLSYLWIYCNDGVYKEDIFYVLRAFSHFKAYQKSSIKLVICLESKLLLNRLKLDTYRYKQDVLVIDSILLEECNYFVTNAYAAIYPFDTHTGLQILELIYTFRHACPTIAIEDSYVQALSDNSVFYVDRKKTSSLVWAMKNVFRDEILRDDLSRRAKHRADSMHTSSNAQLLKSIID